MIPLPRNQRKLFVGLIAIAFGLAGLWFARGLPMGTRASMGPGYMPVMVSILIVILGVAVLAQSWIGPAVRVEPMTLRPVAMISIAIGLFALLIDWAGLIVSVFLTAVVGGLGGRFRLVELLILALTSSFLFAFIFVYLLSQPISLWPEF